jgi:alpha 1,3-glucosidase
MVKHGDFKTCAQSGFCKRQQSFAQSRDGNAVPWTYTVDSKSLNIGSVSNSLLSGTIKGQPALGKDVLFSMEMRAFEGGMRLVVKELNPLRPVYEGTAEYTLSSDSASTLQPVSLVQDASKSTDAAPVYAFGNGNTVKLNLSPFSLEWSRGETPVLTFNERGYLYYEHARAKAGPEPVLVTEGSGDGSAQPPPPVETFNETLAKVQEPEYLQADLWDESFGGKTDSKPFGKFDALP